MASDLVQETWPWSPDSLKLSLWLLIMFSCKTKGMSRSLEKNAASFTLVSAGIKYIKVFRNFESIW